MDYQRLFIFMLLFTSTFFPNCFLTSPFKSASKLSPPRIPFSSMRFPYSTQGKPFVRLSREYQPEMEHEFPFRFVSTYKIIYPILDSLLVITLIPITIPAYKLLWIFIIFSILFILMKSGKRTTLERPATIV